MPGRPSGYDATRPAQNRPYVNYAQYVPAASNRYLQMIYGPGGAEGYVGTQVRGAATAFQPYFNQMSKQGAAGVASRGGGGGGAGDAILSDLYSAKTGALTQAAAGAQKDVNATTLATLGLGQNEASMLSADERARLQYELEKAYFEYMKKKDNRDFWGNLIGDVTRAGAYVAGGI